VKRLLVTDTHLGLYTDSDLWLDIVLNFFKNITKYCIQNDIKQIIHLGDFFDNRKSLNTKTQQTAHRIAKVLELAKNLDTYIIVGNHDCYYKNQIHPTTLELFKKYSNIHVIDKITKLDDILLVPWGEIPENTQGAKYCFGHFAINGFHMNDSYKCKTGIDSAKFKDFEKVFSGHFHSPSSNKNIVYLGAPYGQTFHDAGGVRGYHIFENGKLEFIEYTEAPKFVKIYTNAEALDENKIKGNIVRIIFTRDFGTTQNQTIIDDILKYEPLLYSVNFANLESEEEQSTDENIEMESKEKIVDQFIDNQTFATNINILTLKTMFKKLLKEAGENKTNIKLAEGTKIECLEVGFQNFLSFGSKWQDIPLINGVNFVTGYDKDKGKSNGAGKSSFLETIPFALFGKTARDIKQDQIINWKNKGNCQVVFRFKINDDLYEINRKLKPNNLEIFKNGELMDQDAHKADYQTMFEDIFGMDVKMFMSLIHSNVNNSGSILSMKKPEKRAFLEKMFGLEIYSDMNQLSNEKLRNIEQKKYKLDTDVNSCDDKINSANDLKIKFAIEIKNKKTSLEGLNELKEQLDKLIEDNPNVKEKLDDIVESITIKKEELNQITLEHEKWKAKKSAEFEQIQKDIKKIENQEEQRKRNAELKADINDIIEKIGSFKDIQDDIKENENNIEINDKELIKYREESLKLQKNLTELETNLKNIEKNLSLLSEGKCPVCGQDVTDPKGHYEKELSVFKQKIDIQKKKISKNDSSVKKINEDIDTKKKRISILRRSSDKLVNLESQIKDVGSEEEKDKLLKNKDELYNLIKNVSEKHAAKVSKLNNEINILKNKNTDLSENLNKIKNKQREYDIAISKAEEVKKSIESLHNIMKEQDEKIDKLNVDKKQAMNSKLKMNDIIDYLNAIKFILKDENIKQFTIKQIMPFLNKQTNRYLAEVNYSFYVSIDKWLDVEIKGPGIRNATYESLSGGERRGIDIALQLSLLDIARNQAGLFPDMLVFDELLDSSIDSTGMDQIMKIIKIKQKEFGGKIFIISHRSEIDAELIDNEYKILKEGGYSKVMI